MIHQIIQLKLCIKCGVITGLKTWLKLINLVYTH